MTLRVTAGMKDDRYALGLHGSPERTEPGLVEVVPVDRPTDLETPEPEIVNDAVHLGDGEVDVPARLSFWILDASAPAFAGAQYAYSETKVARPWMSTPIRSMCSMRAAGFVSDSAMAGYITAFRSLESWPMK
jgi:hypothetical protein